MFQLFLVPLLLLQVYTGSCEDLEATTETPDYVTLDYSEFEVIFPGEDEELFMLADDEYEADQKTSTSRPADQKTSTSHPNSASSIYPSYVTIAALFLFYLLHLVLHQGLHGYRRVRQTSRTQE